MRRSQRAAAASRSSGHEPRRALSSPASGVPLRSRKCALARESTRPRDTGAVSRIVGGADPVRRHRLQPRQFSAQDAGVSGGRPPLRGHGSARRSLARNRSDRCGQGRRAVRELGGGVHVAPQSEADRQRRKQFALGHSWSVRAELFANLLASDLPDTPRAPYDPPEKRRMGLLMGDVRFVEPAPSSRSQKPSYAQILASLTSTMATFSVPSLARLPIPYAIGLSDPGRYAPRPSGGPDPACRRVPAIPFLAGDISMSRQVRHSARRLR